MWLKLPLAPLPHGALGLWDEILNLLPLVVGAGLLVYLYLNSRKRRAEIAAREQPPAEPEPAAHAEPDSQPGP